MRYLKNLDKGKGSIELCHSVSWCDNHTTASFEESDMWIPLLVINCTWRVPAVYIRIDIGLNAYEVYP